MATENFIPSNNENEWLEIARAARLAAGKDADKPLSALHFSDELSTLCYRLHGLVAAVGGLIAHDTATRPPTTTFVVARRALPAGRVLRAADLGTVALHLPAGVSVVPGRLGPSLVGRRTAHAIPAPMNGASATSTPASSTNTPSNSGGYNRYTTNCR